MTVPFDYDATVRTAFAFALQYPTASVWIVAVFIAAVLADLVGNAIYLVGRRRSS